MYAPPPMAKSKRNKPEEASAQSDGSSLLEVAWRAYEAGDAVMARRAAKLVLSGGAKASDESVARRLGPVLFVGAPPVDARQVAAEIAARTRSDYKPYVFVVIAAVIWVLLVI